MTENDEPLEPITLGASDAWDAPSAASPDAGPSRSHRSPAVFALVIVMIVAGLTGYFVTSSLRTSTSMNASTAPGSLTPRNPNTSPSDPKQSALSSIVVQQQDVTGDHTVGLLNDGDRLTEPTLDLCNGTFPSEKLRTARLQVAEVTSDDTAVLSTEAVLYKNDAAAAQAFAELQQVARACPHRPVASPTGGDTLQTTFNAPPDKNWPATPTVSRLAYDFNSVGPGGDTSHFVTAYLRRGRALLGVYFEHPDGAQPAVRGRTTVPSIVQLFEKRLAALPNSVVNR